MNAAATSKGSNEMRFIKSRLCLGFVYKTELLIVDNSSSLELVTLWSVALLIHDSFTIIAIHIIAGV